MDDEVLIDTICQQRGVGIHDTVPARLDRELLVMTTILRTNNSSDYPWIGQSMPYIQSLQNAHHLNHRLLTDHERNGLVTRRLTSDWFSYQIKKILPESSEQLNRLSLSERLTKFQPIIQLFHDYISDFLRLSQENQDAFLRKIVEILQHCSCRSHPIYHVCEQVLETYLYQVTTQPM
jgi:hypothetical protein